MRAVMDESRFIGASRLSIWWTSKPCVSTRCVSIAENDHFEVVRPRPVIGNRNEEYGTTTAAIDAHCTFETSAVRLQ
jgi:hypothetical protein